MKTQDKPGILVPGCTVTLPGIDNTWLIYQAQIGQSTLGVSPTGIPAALIAPHLMLNDFGIFRTAIWIRDQLCRQEKTPPGPTPRDHKGWVSEEPVDTYFSGGSDSAHLELTYTVTTRQIASFSYYRFVWGVDTQHWDVKYKKGFEYAVPGKVPTTLAEAIEAVAEFIVVLDAAEGST